MMNIVGIILFFILGAATGSLGNMYIYRKNHGWTMFFPKKCRCEVCKHDLSLLDILPVVGYLIRGGRCAYCGEKIKISHLLVEAVNGAFFMLMFLKYGYSIQTVAGCIMVAALSICLVSDIATDSIQDGIAYIAVAIGFASSFFTRTGWISSAVGIALFVVVYVIIYLLSRGYLGGSDVKLAAITAAFAGLPGVFICLFLSTLFAAIAAIVLMIIHRGKRHGIRFSPILAVCGFIAYAYTEEVINFYAAMFPNQVQ